MIGSCYFGLRSPHALTPIESNWGTNVITLVCQILWHNLCWARFFHTMNLQKKWRCVLSNSKARCSDMGSLWACPVSGDIGRSCCFGPLVLWFQRVPCCRCVSNFPKGCWLDAFGSCGACERKDTPKERMTSWTSDELSHELSHEMWRDVTSDNGHGGRLLLLSLSATTLMHRRGKRPAFLHAVM